LARAIQQIAFLEVVHFDLDKMDAKSFWNLYFGIACQFYNLILPSISLQKNRI
jgi:hypothetical protein